MPQALLPLLPTLLLAPHKKTAAPSSLLLLLSVQPPKALLSLLRPPLSTLVQSALKAVVAAGVADREVRTAERVVAAATDAGCAVAHGVVVGEQLTLQIHRARAVRRAVMVGAAEAATSEAEHSRPRARAQPLGAR